MAESTVKAQYQPSSEILNKEEFNRILTFVAGYVNIYLLKVIFHHTIYEMVESYQYGTCTTSKLSKSKNFVLVVSFRRKDANVRSGLKAGEP